MASNKRLKMSLPGFSTSLRTTSEVIDDNGDVVLVVGPDKARMRVSSTILMRGSRVFAAMFSGNFAEGLDLSPTRPKNIDLPDDDANVMRILVLMLHHQNSLVPSSPTLPELLALFKLADKYDCMIAIQFATRFWLQQMTAASLKECSTMVGLAYLANDPAMFCRYTHALMYEHPWSITDLYRCFIEQATMLPHTFVWLICLMDKQRTEVHEKIELHIENLPEDAYMFVGEREWRTNGEVLRTVVRSHLHDTAGAPIFVCKTIAEAVDVVRNLKGLDKIFKGEDEAGMKDVAEFMEKLVEKLEERCCGLCLSCFRYGDDQVDSCIGHSHQAWGNLPQHSHPLAPVPRYSGSWPAWLKGSWEYPEGMYAASDD